MVSLKKTLSLVSEKKSKDFKDPSPERTPPPSYQVDSLDDQNLVGSIRKLRLTNRSSSTQTLPTNDQCIAHLKLLTTLSQLREEISETNGLFGLSDDLAQNNLGPRDTVQDIPGLIKIREKRWAVYVTRAADRFQKWWSTLTRGQGSTPNLHMDDLLQPKRLDSVMDPMQILNWRAEMLPPIDVLMVLHSFMLNPRNFLEDCLRYGMIPLWHAGFPWELINTAINDHNFEYAPSSEVVATFESKTGLSWDNLQDPLTRKITCEQCTRESEHAYTEASFGHDSKKAFECSRGYADKAFEMKCKYCGSLTNHQSLCLSKLRRDVLQLVQHGVPMPGTVLSVDGLPEAAKHPDPNKHEVFFPNRLILAGLSTSLLDLTEPNNNRDGLQLAENVRKAIESGIRDRSLVTKANGKVLSKTLKKGERIATRRMMSNYWDNSSPFALDLVGAVVRQGIFVEKMKGIDWIHSPALENTMTRLISKYEVFFQILQGGYGKIAVPTLDVDLAWHTHQLTPKSYFEYSLAHANNQFIDHDDKIAENRLSNAFEWTSRQYEKLTGGEVYSECTCWYCEAIREAATNRSLFSSSKGMRDKAVALYERKDIHSDPKKNAHISAHNAVKAESLAADRIAQAQAYKLEADYQRAAKRAKKAGKEPPNRTAYMTAYVWGYPMYMPMYFYPFAADPCVSGGMYAANPACGSTTLGAVGNCVSGACGGGFGGSGACGGAMGGGGCGGSGGGCGGGGGGGGCGGGGGA